MRLTASEPELAILIDRLRRGDLDLQPDFQRGEVWSVAKRQRLIDSVLRNWHVPPIHVIETASGVQEVLDGQQRLAAARDFVYGEIVVDGAIEPYDPDIEALDGLSYAELPPRWRRQFDSFPIRLIRISEYSPEEPGELFFRLNQPANLTAAEARNAFYGPAREEIKALVSRLETLGIDKATIGFGNARMAYDDVLARFLTCLENASIREKVTASTLASRYRSTSSFDAKALSRAESTIELFASVRNIAGPGHVLNKATLFSWLWFLVRFAVEPAASQTIHTLATFYERVGAMRRENWTAVSGFDLSLPAAGNLLRIYESRATARVADVSSVVLRDVVLWVFFASLSNVDAARTVSSKAARQFEVARQLRSHYEDRALRSPIDGPPTDDELLDLAVRSARWGLLE